MAINSGTVGVEHPKMEQQHSLQRISIIPLLGQGTEERKEKGIGANKSK